jgi:hypothetical protein
VGVLFDYFRAADADAATVADGPDWAGPLYPRDAVEPFDGVDAKGIDPVVVLGQLVGFVQGVTSIADLVNTTGAALQADEQDDHANHGVLEILDETRDVLASVTEEQVPQLAARWAEIEEFGGYADADALAGTVTELVALSRRAKAAGEHVYCWWSL